MLLFNVPDTLRDLQPTKLLLGKQSSILPEQMDLVLVKLPHFLQMTRPS